MKWTSARTSFTTSRTTGGLHTIHIITHISWKLLWSSGMWGWLISYFIIEQGFLFNSDTVYLNWSSWRLWSNPGWSSLLLKDIHVTVGFVSLSCFQENQKWLLENWCNFTRPISSLLIPLIVTLWLTICTALLRKTLSAVQRMHVPGLRDILKPW